MTHGPTSKPRILIVGGGFGGLAAARALARTDADVLLIDRRNHHCFQPLLYQVATAGLSPADIAEPIRRVLRRQENVEVMMANVARVDLEARSLECQPGGTLSYDYLVLAAGARHAYFGHDEWAKWAPGLKTIDDALEIRRRMLLAYEAAELERNEDARRRALTFVVVGGGPTGVELAGALREIAANSIPKDFRHVDTKTARIVLIEGQARLLPSMSAGASERALEDLRVMGVEVRLNTLVTDMDARGVFLGDTRLEAGNVFWAAGVRAASLSGTLGVPTDRAGRVIVRPDCSVPGHPEVFVIGDQAAQVDSATKAQVPGVAQGALQMGAFVGNILHEEIHLGATAQSRAAFCYRDKGSMATIGRARAVADLARHTYGGLIAWLLWCVVHVMFLVSFRNRLFVMFGWAYGYLIHMGGARLITGMVGPEVSETSEQRPEFRPNQSPRT